MPATTTTTMLVTIAAGSQRGAGAGDSGPSLFLLIVGPLPAHRGGERVGDELVQAHLLALGRLGELRVERLRHPQQQAAAVAVLRVYRRPLGRRVRGAALRGWRRYGRLARPGALELAAELRERRLRVAG